MNSAKLQGTRPTYPNQFNFYTLAMNNPKIKLRKQFHLSKWIASKRIKYFGINLTKDMQDLYTENYKTLMKEIIEAQINGNTFCVHGLKDLILRYQYYPMWSTNSTQSLLKSQ